MTKQQKPWDPHTRVSFPKSAHAHVEFEHDGVRFAKATDVPNMGEPDATANFVQDNVFGAWHRISTEDFETITGRLKAEPMSRLAVCGGEHKVTFTFGPPGSEFQRLIERGDEHDVRTVITVSRLDFIEEAA